jgi:3'-5' exonuclease
LNLLAFDIETIPDVDSGRRLFDLEGLEPADVARAMYHRRRQETGPDFLPLHLHRVAAISVAMRDARGFRVWSLGDPEADEAELVARFFKGLERFRPVLVSWNGGGFDLPVLHYRALHHGVPSPVYWEIGDEETSFRYNNYLSRFHWRHIDLMDVLAGFNPRANARLEEIAVMLGLPGKLGMHGSLVWERFLDGDMASIRNYCETDALNTYLIHLRFALMRGHLSPDAYREEQSLVATHLADSGEAHFKEFLEHWQYPAPSYGGQVDD